ncbi:substrate-binding domain-containing protein [Robiginitomaculum antarcticum]|uniref:substrate-binding domain-containing protein n=1 Tax=Robiginitomaculum antarcticum TaxID=437507 RepID=UPI0003736021|nr:substrate-binding domain-containing protein [Robiginitomaculum antarcticum]
MKHSLMIALLSSTVMLTACGGDKPAETRAETSAVKATAPSEQTEIRIVGSSTVYPFSTKVAQEYKNKTGQNVVVESTGSGGGHKLFCDGNDMSTPDITNSSRRQKSSELKKCKANGVGGVVEVKIGYDGIVIANSRSTEAMPLTLKQIYMAFAKDVPVSDTDCTMQANPYTLWSDIDPTMPKTKIEAFGPPPTSGTRDAFVEVAMEGGAKQVACLAEMKNSDGKMFKNIAHTLREDGYWIDSGENDNAIVQTLVNTPTAIGIFGYSFLDQNGDKIRGAFVDGAEPTFENIASGAYPISRSLFFYIKKSHVAQKSVIKDFALEFTDEGTWGPGGYLEEIGLVPLPDAQRVKYRAAVENMTPYSQ